MRKTNTLILAAILISIITSCGKGEAYFEFEKVEKGEWHRDTVLVFNVDSLTVNPLLKYDIQLDIVYTSLYPYHDLWMMVTNNIIDSIFLSDTIQTSLIDDYGKRTGSGNLGLYQLSVPYKTNIKLDTITPYTVSVGHAMRDIKLKGIEKIGLKIYESE